MQRGDGDGCKSEHQNSAFKRSDRSQWLLLTAIGTEECRRATHKSQLATARIGLRGNEGQVDPTVSNTYAAAMIQNPDRAPDSRKQLASFCPIAILPLYVSEADDSRWSGFEPLRSKATGWQKLESRGGRKVRNPRTSALKIFPPAASTAMLVMRRPITVKHCLVVAYSTLGAQDARNSESGGRY
ncbi:hypothetical protein BOTBODRAFT_141886 [Botryobasidium botryosum FD-172 SS1]|uniref:Uncharacterized protein n=1 Tax=Botryobasidium botryosum (strain FD-172 SS1) TaxID=930990 RepID=A0A067NCM4_BOTB1|nr:hypothetical protein BOTBODRAFT_141886 [Botryobasidium botryosum FD-172 SS1]